MPSLLRQSRSKVCIFYGKWDMVSAAVFIGDSPHLFCLNDADITECDDRLAAFFMSEVTCVFAPDSMCDHEIENVRTERIENVILHVSGGQQSLFGAVVEVGCRSFFLVAVFLTASVEYDYSNILLHFLESLPSQLRRW